VSRAGQQGDGQYQYAALLAAILATSTATQPATGPDTNPCLYQPIAYNPNTVITGDPNHWFNAACSRSRRIVPDPG